MDINKETNMDEEKLKKDLEALEAEKKDFLDGKLKDNEPSKEDSEEKSEEFEELETEEMEFSLTEEEIDEWINELTRLKEDKEFILLEVDEENTLKIDYQENSGNEESEDEEDEEDSEVDEENSDEDEEFEEGRE